MKNIRTLLLAGIMITTMSGCHQLQQNRGLGFYIPDDKKYMPKMDKTASLLGQDLNRNGIRDDIDHYINNRFQSPDQINNVEALARGLQEPLRILSSSNSKLEVINKRYVHKANMEQLIQNDFKNVSELSDHKLFKTIQGLTFNTKLRRNALYAFEQCHLNDKCLNYLGQ